MTNDILNIESADPNAFYLHEDIASGEMDGWDFKVWHTVPNRTMIVTFTKGKQKKVYKVSIHAIMDCVVHRFTQDTKKK